MKSFNFEPIKDQILSDHKLQVTNVEICRKHKVSEMTLRKFLKSQGILNSRKRKYTLNQNYFEIIDTEEKAYWLGFLYADGCNDIKRLILGLTLSDIGHIEKFKKAIGANHKIYIHKRKGGELVKNSKEIAQLEIKSRKICEDLSKVGCIPKKTFTLKFPTEEQVPRYLMRHLIRGFMDGDGSFTQYFAKAGLIKYNASFISSADFLEGMQKVFQEEINLRSNFDNHADKKYKKGIRVLKLFGQEETYNLLSWLYDDCTIYLDRKYEKYRKMEQDLKGPAKHVEPDICSKENPWDGKSKGFIMHKEVERIQPENKDKTFQCLNCNHIYTRNSCHTSEEVFKRKRPNRV